MVAEKRKNVFVIINLVVCERWMERESQAHRLTYMHRDIGFVRIDMQYEKKCSSGNRTLGSRQQLKHCGARIL